MSEAELENINAIYNELDDAVVNLPKAIEDVAMSFENEFLTTYRIHIMSIHEEMKVLKDKIKAAQDAINISTTVAKLEHMVNWFRSQAELHESSCGE